MARGPPWDIRERAFCFACELVVFCQKLAQKRGCWSIADQLLRAGTGVAANAEEAKRLEIKVARVTWNGRTFDVYPDRT